MTQGTQTGLCSNLEGWDRRRWEGGSRESDVFTYGWFMLMYSRNQLDGHEAEQAPGVGDGQGGLACCSPWGRKKSDTPERLN